MRVAWSVDVVFLSIDALFCPWIEKIDPFLMAEVVVAHKTDEEGQGEPYLFGSSWCNNYDLATHSRDLLENRDEKSIIILHFISSERDLTISCIKTNI